MERTTDQNHVGDTETPPIADARKGHEGEYGPRSENPDPADKGVMFRDPHEWAKDVNPGYPSEEGTRSNCAECTRASEQTWRGDPEVAATMEDGEPMERMSDWTGMESQPRTYSEIGDTLARSGPGSSALVASHWDGGGGHWFNAMNVDGQVVGSDGQSGLVEDWPPTASGLGWDEADAKQTFAIIRDPHGNEVR
jgi:hypothetical protein